jgi:hypothetical protein
MSEQNLAYPSSEVLLGNEIEYRYKPNLKTLLTERYQIQNLQLYGSILKKCLGEMYLKRQKVD